jgi:hypothetical protein
MTIRNTLADELPLDHIPDVHAWSENYCFDGHDAAADAGFWFHCGRWPRNPSIWREQIMLYLPGGDYLIMRGFGHHPVENGVGGALLKCICLEPGQRWRLLYSGPARRETLASMMAGTHTHLSEGPYVTVDVDLEFEATRPAWDFGTIVGEAWANFHYEQHGRVTGTIRYDTSDGGSSTVTLNGNGYRDHSRGPRDLSAFGGFHWHHAQFPGGRAFSIVRSYKYEAGALSVGVNRAVVFDGEKMLPAEIVGELPVMTDKQLPAERYTITLKSDLGEMVIEARTHGAIALSCDKFMDTYDGIATPAEGVYAHYCFEQPTEYVWNGLTGAGWTERAMRA